MKKSLQLIIIGTTRTGEKSLVLHTLSAEYGRRSFLAKAGTKNPGAMFLPLNIIEAVVTENPKSDLWYAGSLTSLHPLEGIRSDLYKNTMSLFMAEVLFRTLRDGLYEPTLFDWCRRCILTLDALGADFSNYHIRFLLELAQELGFSPTFDAVAPYAQSNIAELRQFMESDTSEAMLIPLNGSSRNEMASALIRYLEHHTEAAINIRSLAVLREIFS